MDNSISEVTRREIVDSFHLRRVSWSGRLPEDQFLARLYNLASLPSTEKQVDADANGAKDAARVRWMSAAIKDLAAASK